MAGVLGVAFNRALVGTLDLFQSIRRWPAWAPGAARWEPSWAPSAGSRPRSLGGGHRLVEHTLAGHVALLRLAGVFVLRFVLTMLSYGCGAPGGIFAPLLVLGSELGLGVGVHRAACPAPQAVDHPETFAVVGMAAYFSAIVRAPLTGIVLVVEMTGNYSLVLPAPGRLPDGLRRGRSSCATVRSTRRSSSATSCGGRSAPRSRARCSSS